MSRIRMLHAVTFCKKQKHKRASARDRVYVVGEVRQFLDLGFGEAFVVLVHSTCYSVGKRIERRIIR